MEDLSESFHPKARRRVSKKVHQNANGTKISGQGMESYKCHNLDVQYP